MNEKQYIVYRKAKARIQSTLFYFFRIFPINTKKIVFTTLEGNGGYMCNPKYIAEEIINQKLDYELVWLVNDVNKSFPEEIHVVKNTLVRRAFQLTTAKVWVDNSRKQLEVRKRKGQTYIQTWHAKIGFKPTGLDRGKTFSRIAYLVTKHDANMTDYMLSNSDMFDEVAPTGLLYDGEMLRISSPRCDVLVNRTERNRIVTRERFGMERDAKIILWAPTFRKGSQTTNREVSVGKSSLDVEKMLNSLENRFGGKWYVLLRLHPQLAKCETTGLKNSTRIKDITKEEDLYEILSGCDAVLTDYSSVAFDACVMEIPIFLFCDDFEEYIADRGELLWDMNRLPFPFAKDNAELSQKIENFDYKEYQIELKDMLDKINMVEDGTGALRAVEFIRYVSKAMLK